MTADLAGLVACPQCDAIHNERTHACSECGASLEGGARAESAEARRHATHALMLGYRWLGAVSWIYRIGAVGYGIVTAFAILALRDLDVPLGGGIVFVALTALLTVAMLVGAMRVLFEPFKWTVIIASLATLVAAVHLIGPNPLELAFLGTGLCAAVLWAMFVPTQKFQRLMARHEDLYILHHASKETRRALEGRSPEVRHQRLVAAMHRAGRRAWKVTAIVGGLILAATLAGVVFVVTQRRPQAFAPTLAAFEQAWNASDTAAVSAFFPQEQREAKSRWLRGVTAGHGWSDQLPSLGESRTREAPGGSWVEHRIGDLTISTRWALRGLSWRIIEAEMPAPPFEPVLRRFLEDWKRSDPAVLASYFSPENREKMLETIQAAVERRRWSEFPEVIDTLERDQDDGGKYVALFLEAEQITTQWWFRTDGQWGLIQLTFPPK